MLVKLLKLLVLALNIAEFTIFTLVMYLFSFIPGLHDSSFYFSLFRAWCRSFQYALGIDIRLHQKNCIALPEQYILIANHPSAFEDIGIPAVFPVHSLAKIEVKDWFIVGRINYAAGTLYVNREDAESRRGAVDRMAEAIAQGKNIALYPEGGCTGRRITKEFKRGAFELSIKTGVPVVPILIYYQSQEDFEWQPPYNLLDKLWHFIRSKNKTVEMFQYDAVYPTDFKDKYEFAAAMQEFYLKQQTKYLE